MTKRDIAQQLAYKMFSPDTDPTIITSEIDTMMNSKPRIELEAQLWMTKRSNKDMCDV